MIHKNQRGVTVIELIIAIAITGIITGGITTAIFQVFSGSTRTSNHMTAVRQVQKAGYRVSWDTQMAQSVDTDNVTAPDILELTWTDWDSVPHQVIYSLEGEGLWRDDGSSKKSVAQHIDPATSCNFTAGVLTFTVTATVGEETETRVYEIVPRPGS